MPDSLKHFLVFNRASTESCGINSGHPGWGLQLSNPFNKDLLKINEFLLSGRLQLRVK